MSSPFAGPSLQYTGGTDPNNKNYVKLSEALNAADTERRKAQEEAAARERAAEMRREERQRKIAYLRDMPDNKPAGTGELHFTSLCILCCVLYLDYNIVYKLIH